MMQMPLSASFSFEDLVAASHSQLIWAVVYEIFLAFMLLTDRLCATKFMVFPVLLNLPNRVLHINPCE